MKSLRTMTWPAAAAAVALSMGLAGCGGGTPSSAGTDAQGVTNITWWAYGPEQSVADQYIAAFEKDHPDISVTFKLIGMDTYDAALRPALSSNAGPDVYTEDPGARFEEFQHFGTDLTPAFAQALGSDWKTRITELGISGFTKDGKLMAAPVGGDFAGTLWIHKELFDTYDVAIPENFTQWKEACEVFKSHDVGCFVQGAQMTAFDQDTYQAIADTIEPGLYSKAVTGEARWTEPKLVTAFERWKWMFDSGIMQDGALGISQYPDANNAFLSGKYAMVMMGTWYMQNTRVDVMTAGVKAAGKADGEPFTIMPVEFPAAVDGGTKGAMFGDSGGGIAVNAKSKNIDAATTFAVWMGTSTSGQQIVANMMTNTPSMVGVQPDYDNLGLVEPDLQADALKWMISTSETVVEPRHLVDPKLAEALGSALTLVAAGDVDAATAAQNLQKAAEDLGVVFK